MTPTNQRLLTDQVQHTSYGIDALCDLLNADHPLVQEFWEAFDHLDGLPQHTAVGLDTKPRLNHAIDADLIAVNLNEYVELAALHRQQIPVLSELLLGL